MNLRIAMLAGGIALGLTACGGSGGGSSPTPSPGGGGTVISQPERLSPSVDTVIDQNNIEHVARDFREALKGIYQKVEGNWELGGDIATQKLGSVETLKLSAPCNKGKVAQEIRYKTSSTDRSGERVLGQGDVQVLSYEACNTGIVQMVGRNKIEVLNGYFDNSRPLSIDSKMEVLDTSVLAQWSLPGRPVTLDDGRFSVSYEEKNIHFVSEQYERIYLYDMTGLDSKLAAIVVEDADMMFESEAMMHFYRSKGKATGQMRFAGDQANSWIEAEFDAAGFDGDSWYVISSGEAWLRAQSSAARLKFNGHTVEYDLYINLNEDVRPGQVPDYSDSFVWNAERH